jgi:hypothetical protein
MYLSLITKDFDSLRPWVGGSNLDFDRGPLLQQLTNFQQSAIVLFASIT